MKQIFGAALFIIGLAAMVSEVSKYNSDATGWGTIVMIAMIGIGVEMTIIGLIDDAKKELRSEINELRDEVSGR